MCTGTTIYSWRQFFFREIELFLYFTSFLSPLLLYLPTWEKTREIQFREKKFHSQILAKSIFFIFRINNFLKVMIFHIQNFYFEDFYMNSWFLTKKIFIFKNSWFFFFQMFITYDLYYYYFLGAGFPCCTTRVIH